MRKRMKCSHIMKISHLTLFRCGIKLNHKTRSSTQWLQRQRKDPLVKQAILEQYRCRSAFKLIELDDKYRIFRKGSIVIDCGAKPGSWSQVAARRIGTDVLSHDELLSGRAGMVLSVDIGNITDLRGAITLGGCDILDLQTHQIILQYLHGRKADVVMSDMAPNSSGQHTLDHHRIMELCNSASSLASEVLCEGGVFLCKVLQGTHTNMVYRSKSIQKRLETFFTEFLTSLRSAYSKVRECRLKSTRKESTEIYVLAKGYMKV